MAELASGSGKVEAFSFNQDTGDLLGNHRTLSDASLYVRLLFKGFSREFKGFHHGDYLDQNDFITDLLFRDEASRKIISFAWKGSRIFHCGARG